MSMGIYLYIIRHAFLANAIPSKPLVHPQDFLYSCQEFQGLHNFRK